ncbi:MAG: pirin family protein [Acidimicrobiia bacterium]|nr:pirin family protein [Acidimicrobiia bacterium]MDH5238779.1 pirin family protein [Acidimicrobiia bacterium]
MSTPRTTSVRIVAADDRFHTDFGWLDSRHSFSFGHHFDPDNTGHGLLIVSNDDRVAPGAGFGTHAHGDMEIVTWVLEGRLEHRDSEGNEGLLYPGLAQRMSAGRGIRHSEMNHSATEPVHFVQMWVPPDTTGLPPGYEQRDLNDDLTPGLLIPVASGRGHDGAIAIHQRHAVMWVARLGPTQRVGLPIAPYVHLFVAKGRITFDEHDLSAGDAARITDAASIEVTAVADAEIIVWESALTAVR